MAFSEPTVVDGEGFVRSDGLDDEIGEFLDHDDAPLLDTVLVEASKLGESLAETDKSVGRVAGEKIERAQLRQMQDAFRLMGNVRGSQFTDSGFVIRGVNSEAPDAENYSGSQTPLSTVFVDGVALTQEGARRGPTGLWDVRSVEVLRGPQSTLQGRNSLAGSVNIQTVDPLFEWAGAARLRYGDFNLFEQAVMLNLPVNDWLALRITAEHSERDSLINAPNLKDFERFDEFDTNEYALLRVKLLAEPEAFPLRSLLTYSFSESRPTSNDVFGPDFFDREWRSASGSQQIRETQNHLLAWKNSVDISNTLAFEGLTTLAIAKLDVGQIDGSQVRTDREREISQELRWNWDDDWGKAVIGGYANLAQGESTLSGIEKRRRNVAFFGEIDYLLTDSLHFIGGGRIDYDHFEFKAVGNDEAMTSNTEFLPKLGLRYEFSEFHHLGVTFQRGYRNGGVFIGLGGEERMFDPSTTWHQELFYRNRFLDDRLHLSANAFYTRWRDQQVVVRDVDISTFEVDEQILNAGTSSLYGAEVEVSFQPFDSFRITGSIGLLKTRFDDFDFRIDPEIAGFLNVPDRIDFSGYEFPEAPEVNASIGFEYGQDTGFFLSADVKYLSSFFSPVLFAPLGSGLGVSVQAPQSSVVEVDSHVTLNASVGYRAENWDLVFFAENLLDEQYLVGKLPNAVRDENNRLVFEDDFLATVGPGRFIGAAFQFRF
ncbi:MAG: TonB-dependent receptor [Verrucomicrobiota bacterium]